MSDQQMLREWEAWKAMCRVLRTLGVEINNEDGLATAIKTWGDDLVTLRQAQAAEGKAQTVRQPVLSTARRGREES